MPCFFPPTYTGILPYVREGENILNRNCYFEKIALFREKILNKLVGIFIEYV